METGSQTQTYDSLESDVISDFTNEIVFKRYSSLLNSTVAMQDAVSQLVATTTADNLNKARSGWKALRSDW